MATHQHVPDITWGYARISDDDRLEGRGVSRQEEDIHDHAKRNGWDVERIITENDISASRYAKRRKGWADLLAAIENGEVGRLLVYDVDRLLRQNKELEELIDRCDPDKCKPNGWPIGFQVHNLNGDMDLTTSDGRFIARLLVAKAGKESDDLSRRLRRANKTHAASGRHHGGSRSIGYQLDPSNPGHLIIDEREADFIRDGVARLIRGESIGSVVRAWNEAGFKTAGQGRPDRPHKYHPPAAWSNIQVRKALAAPRIAGLRAHDGRLYEATTWEPIITPDEHELVVSILRTNAGRKRNANVRRWPLTGLLYCGQCKGRMKGSVRTDDGRGKYLCNGKQLGQCKGGVSISAEHADAEVRAWLEEHLLSAAWKTQLADAQERLSRLGDAQHQLGAQRAALLEHLTQLEERATPQGGKPAEIDLDAFVRLQTAAKAELAEVEQQIRVASSTRRPQALGSGDPAIILAAYDDPDLPPADRHDLVTDFIKRIEVSPAKARGPAARHEKRLVIEGHF